MARLEAPVTNTRRVAPAASASSTAYWISGLSTTGSISFGLALVAGRKRVPRPATGNTAVRMAGSDLMKYLEEDALAWQVQTSQCAQLQRPSVAADSDTTVSGPFGSRKPVGTA